VDETTEQVAQAGENATIIPVEICIRQLKKSVIFVRQT
jgi:hypothetical protein